MRQYSISEQCVAVRPFASSAEAEVVALAKAGNGSAFAELVHRNYRSSLRSACAVVTNVTTAQDVVASAFCMALEHLDQFKAGQFSFWLHRIVMNECYSNYRKAQRWSPQEFEEKIHTPEARPESWHTLTPEEQLNRTELLALLSREIAKIPKFLRVPLLMKVNGHTIQGIAAEMGISESAVKARVHRARVMLKHSVQCHLIRHPVRSLVRAGS
jgi:RNA polymerase sigma-70 factor, ECF subfamily